MNGIKVIVIPQLSNGLIKPFIEPPLHLQFWEEIIVTCIDIDIKSTETVIVLKLKNKKVGLHIAPDKIGLNLLNDLIGNEMGILRTEDCFLVQQITHIQQASKDRFYKELEI